MNIGLITARGGSKGLPRKNILDLNGIPLIAWTIKAAQESKNIDRIFVSTEDEDIINIAKRFGAEIIIRPAKLAQDDTSSEPVIEHAIYYLRNNNIPVKTVCLLQPTSPLRTNIDIDNSYNLFQEKDTNCIISVIESEHSASKAYKRNPDGSISGLLFEDAPYCRRQDLPETYHPNGAIYLFLVGSFLKESRIPRTKVYPYIMAPLMSLDIDTKEDLIKVEKIIQAREIK